MDILELSDVLGWTAYLFPTCGVAAILAAILPPATRQSPRWWKAIRRVIDGLGGNVLNARNRVQ